MSTMAKSNRAFRSKIASHRGGSDLWPENSMTAFRNTAERPVEQVEFDVHPTRDGLLVVHHDPTLDRMTDGEGPISARTFDELSAFIINGTEADRIPLLSDVLRLFKPTDLKIRLEIKGNANMQPYGGLEMQIATTLREQGMLNRSVITSFFTTVLETFGKIERETPRIWLVNRMVFRHTDGISSVLSIAKAQSLAEVALHATDLGSAEMKAAALAGIRLGAYGVNDEPTIRRMIDLGVDIFTTDRPDLALKIRAESSPVDGTQ